MKAARLVAPGQLEVVDAPTPTAADGECLIRLQQVSVCGSDLRKGFRRQTLADSFPGPIGFPGHECAGVVVESRADAVHPGDSVVVHPHGLTGMVEYLAARPERLAVVPSDGNLTAWLLAEPPATVLHGVRALEPVLGKRVGIIGQGMIGLSWTHFMNRLGAAEIVVFDLEPSRLAWSRRLGATDVVHVADPAAFPSDDWDAAFDVVVEATGEEGPIEIAPRLARHGGTVVLFATASVDRISYDHRTLRDRELRVVCTAPGRGADTVGRVIADMVALVQRGWLDTGQFATHRLPFERIQEAFELYDSRRNGVIKVILSI